MNNSHKLICQNDFSSQLCAEHTFKDLLQVVMRKRQMQARNVCQLLIQQEGKLNGEHRPRQRGGWLCSIAVSAAGERSLEQGFPQSGGIQTLPALWEGLRAGPCFPCITNYRIYPHQALAPQQPAMGQAKAIEICQPGSGSSHANSK